MTASINTGGTEPRLTEFIESTGGAMPYDDDTAENETQTLDEWASELFLLYITQAACWFNPTRGAVSPALGDFFSRCDPETPALVHWARWLRLEHESDEGIQIFSPEVAEALVEAMIAACVKNPKEASAMRRAVRGEPIGERDPNQLGLFGEEDL
jgi:hypothetical protein